jgi:uncharacterized protein YbjT (DUF2867 family)
MRVLVTGAYGLIGSACLARLHRDGHEVTGAGRDVREASLRASFAKWITADFRNLTLAGDWLPLLEGFDAVVNCVGVLQDGMHDSVQRIQVAATTALFAACERAGIKRVVHISAIGAARAAPTAFARSKAEAEDNLSRRQLDWVILRPGLVLSPAVYGGTAMLRGVCGVPFVTPVLEPDARLQVVGVDDVAAAVAHSLTPDAKLKVKWDVAHPDVLSLETVVSSIRDWLGFRKRPIWRVPRGLGAVVSAVADVLGYLGWRSPARSTAVRQLAAGIIGAPGPWVAATGIEPKSLQAILAQQPSSVTDRWFARLFLFKPVAIAGLALFWIATGIITLGPGSAVALGHLKAAGVPPKVAGPLVLAGALYDYFIGLGLLLRPVARIVLHIMLWTTVLYLVAGSVFAPQLWTDPLGPYLKIVPVLIATLFTIAIMDDR